MRGEAQEHGVGTPISLRELGQAAAAPRIVRFDHSNDVVPCSGATTTLEWEVANVDQVVITDEQGDSETFDYQGGGTHSDELEVRVDIPPFRFELEAIGEGGSRSRTATTTVGRILDGRSYSGEVLILNPDGSERTYDITVYDQSGSQQVATLEEGEREVVDESTLTDCVTYRFEATDQAGTLRSEVSFVFLSDASGFTWNLPPGRP